MKKDKALGYAKEARTFIIKILSTNGNVLGYAVAERDRFIPVEEAARGFPAFRGGLESLDKTFEAFQRAQEESGVRGEVVMLPSRKDAKGEGVTTLAPSDDDDDD